MCQEIPLIKKILIFDLAYTLLCYDIQYGHIIKNMKVVKLSYLEQKKNELDYNLIIVYTTRVYYSNLEKKVISNTIYIFIITHPTHYQFSRKIIVKF